MINEATYTGYKKTLLAGDRFNCKDIVQTLLDNKIDIKELYTDLFQRSMYEVGELWENNRISVANEHLATAITEPHEDMAQFIDEKKPDLVGLSLSILSNIKNLEGALDAVRTDFPTMDLLVGGQAFRWGGLDVIKKYKNAEYISTLNDLETVIKNG
jgi:methanogenic corrinoid protein MtbC1